MLVINVWLMMMQTEYTLCYMRDLRLGVKSRGSGTFIGNMVTWLGKVTGVGTNNEIYLFYYFSLKPSLVASR